MIRSLLRGYPCFGMVALLAALAPPALAVSPPAYVTQWGTAGTGSGQFSQPAGVATDGAGFVYVADTGNNRIQKFTTAGVYVSQWGTLGAGNGQLNGPFGLTVAGGKVFVVDTGNFRVQVFTTGGAYLYQWGSPGTGNGQFSQPLCVAVDGAGAVFVTDYNQNRVQKFTNTGSYLTQWGSTGPGSGQFSGMAGIALDMLGDIYITDTGNNIVQVFAPNGFYTGQIGGGGPYPITFNGPLGVTTDGIDPYVVDTMNHRMVLASVGGYPQTQWGVLGTGNGQFNGPHSAAYDTGFIYVADTEQHRIQKFGVPTVEQCTNCESPSDVCCEALPEIGGPWTNILVGTREPALFFSNPYAVTIFDLNASPLPPEDADWASMTRYHGPANSWTGDSLGSVFGLTLDEYGNIFVTHTSCYNGDLIGQVFNGGPGAVYRIDGVTGVITTFCTLPNFPDGSVFPPEDMPGLGNITYDCTHQQFFVTDIEDGKIYRIKPVGVNGTTGTVVETFDPLVPDNGLPGWAPMGQRLWGVQWHGNRVYYSVWAMDYSDSTGPNPSPNEIRSIGLTALGAFIPSSDKHELNVPLLAGRPYSNPVADISFSAAGKMLLGERAVGYKTNPGAHDARVLEFACSGGCWLPANKYGIGAYYAKENAAGGVDYDLRPFGGPTSPIGRVWASGDAIHLNTPYFDSIYGYQGLRPNLAIGSNLNSMLIDSDGQVVSGDKTYHGDVEAPGCPAPALGAICGQKFRDLNHNGVKDGGEPGVPNWAIQISGPGGTYTVLTDANGNYCFNGLLAGTYTISEIGVSPWIQTAPLGGAFAVILAAGQTVGSRDFGNYLCATSGPGCIQWPPMAIASWPFNEGPGAITSSDASHLNPARNVVQLLGGASFSDAGEVGSALCFGSELAYAKVPNSSQIATTFGAGPFAIDVWVNPDGGTAGQRMIIEKRKLISSSPYRTLGWALYLNGQQCFLEIGNGTATQVVPGPTIAPGQWTHLAVSVDRTPAMGQWYLDGAQQAALAFSPVPGSVSCTADITIGQVSPPFGPAMGFHGCIDELDLFSNPVPPASILPAATVAAIRNAGVIGKCPEFVLMPSVTTICKTQTSVQVCFNICNNTGTPQSYHWSMSGLPLGPGCTVAGPIVFTPSLGTVTVPPGSCTAPICVTIPRPVGLTTQNATSCYAVSIVNDATGTCMTRKGALRADYSCWCVTPQPGLVSVAARVSSGTPISIGIGHPCDPVASPLRISAVALNTDYPDPFAVSLNGLPPGEPVLGTLALTPDGQDPQLTVQVSYPKGHDAAAPYEILIEADLDGDGALEAVGSTVVVSNYDSSQAVGVAPPVGPPSEVQLMLAPNPFSGGTSVNFSLSHADEVEVGVFDLSGRAVRALQRGRLVAGMHRFDWNGRDEQGRRVAAGVYFVRLEVTGRHVESKLVKLR